MKKNRMKDVDSVLSAAEKFYLRGNFQLALKSFEAIQKRLNRDDIAEKIAHCREAVKNENAKQLVKRAQKAQKKGQTDLALGYFQKANTVLNESWISQQIENLRKQVSGRDAVSQAKAAEKAGDFMEAAKFYRAAGDTAAETDATLLLKSARCLVRAGAYAAAVALFNKLTLIDAAGRYDHGFALAQEGRFAQCLRAWADLEGEDDRIEEQKRMVAISLGADIVQRLQHDPDYAPDYASICADAHYLLHTGDGLLTSNQRRTLEGLYDYSASAWIEALWEAEEWETIADILKNYPGPFTPTLLALNAKVWFKLAQADSRHLHTLLLYWLSAIYSPAISDAFADNRDDRQKVRRQLIAMAENLIKKHADTRYGQQALNQLAIDDDLMQTLIVIYEKQAQPIDLICTPRLAAHLGRSDAVLRLIRENEGSFNNRQQYLETGAYYSVAGIGLYPLRNQAYEKAYGFVADLPAAVEKDEFADYALKVIRFEYGLHRLASGDAQAIGYFQSTPALFDIAPALEEKLIQSAVDFENWSDLKPYEDVLALVHRHCPSQAVCKALSLVMSRGAIDKVDKAQLNSKAVKGIINKALQLDPENEMAREALQDAESNIAIKAMQDAFNRRKLGRASQIARESRSEDVRDLYFRFIEDIFDQVRESDWMPEEKLMLIGDLLEWGTTVNSLHPILDRLKTHLDMSQEMVSG